MSKDRAVEAEAHGDTVGEAKWLALRRLEQQVPGLDRDRVVFEVISEGKRGLLGVGTAPAQVRARIVLDPETPAGTSGDESALAATVREVVSRILDALGADCGVQVHEDEASVVVSVSGRGSRLVIGRRGRTLDAIQTVVAAVAGRAQGYGGKTVMVDAASYCARRAARLKSLAHRAAEQAKTTGEPVRLEPMTPAERRIVHLSLAGWAGIETRSEGEEPHRHVVVAPAGDPSRSQA